MSIPIAVLIAAAVCLMSAAALSVSESNKLDTILYIVFYSAVVVSITTGVVEFISRLSCPPRKPLRCLDWPVVLCGSTVAPWASRRFAVGMTSILRQ